jgi:3,4-dihydroxy 2-butanone 4-phosphate synthase
MTQRLDGVERAIAAFRRGDPVLIHDFDDREAETDLVYPAADVTPEAVARLRNDAGGLVCVALADSVADAFDLPLLEESLDHPTAAGEVAYDDRSSFSLSVNHRETYTGITDADRSHTIRALADAAARVPGYDVEDFAADFRSPGHVTLLRAAPSLTHRQGHTELGMSLADAADREPAVVVCEMLDGASGGALPKAAAREYASRHGLAFVEGAALVEAFSGE